MMIRGYRIRLYPTKFQKEIIIQHIGAARFIWNYMIASQQQRYKNQETHMSGYDMCKYLTIIKRQPEYQWLNNIANATLQSVCLTLGGAYKKFFNGDRRYPKFKKKKNGKQSYPLRSDCVYFKKGKVNLAKIGAVKYKTDYIFQEGKQLKIFNPRVSIIDGKYYLSFCLECENQTSKELYGRMGIDVGIKEFAVIAHENEIYRFQNINKSKQLRMIDEKINMTQRSLSRKLESGKKHYGHYVLSNNSKKIIHKLNKLYSRAHGIRINYIHHITSYLCGLSPQTIVVEDLDLFQMGKNVHLKKEIRDQNFSEFFRQIEYKASWNGIELNKADRYYPSSKTCSVCGYVKRDLSLSDRVFICPACNNRIDRDYNAARNLMWYMPSQK